MKKFRNESHNKSHQSVSTRKMHSEGKSGHVVSPELDINCINDPTQISINV